MSEGYGCEGAEDMRAPTGPRLRLSERALYLHNENDS